MAMEHHQHRLARRRVLGVVGLLAVAACGTREGGARQQVVSESAPTPAPTSRVALPTPILATPIQVATPPDTAPRPTRDPRTPVLPTVPVPTEPPTRTSVVLAPTHTPGPPPTPPAGEEAAVHAAFDAAVKERVAAGKFNLDPRFKLGVGAVRVVRQWAYVAIHMVIAVADPSLPIGVGTPVPGTGGIAACQKVAGRWEVAFAGEPRYREILNSMPDELLTPQQRAVLS